MRSDEWWKLSEEWWVMKKRKRKKSKQGLDLRILVVAYPTPIAHHYHNHEDEFLPPNFTVCTSAIIFARFCQCNVRIWRIPKIHNPDGAYSQACAYLNPWVMASLHPTIIGAFLFSVPLVMNIISKRLKMKHLRSQLLGLARGYLQSNIVRGNNIIS